MDIILKFIEFLKNGNLPQKNGVYHFLKKCIQFSKLIIRREILVIYYKIYQYKLQILHII
jgi:hypothetical protein